MTGKQLIVPLVLLIGLAGGIFFITQQQESMAATQMRLAELHATRARLVRSLEQAKRTVVQPANATDNAGADLRDGKRTPPARAPRPPSLMDVGRDNPHFMNAWGSDQRARLQQRYGVLLQNLRLSREQRERFKDIVAAEVARSLDISAAANEKGLEREDPVIRKLQEDSERQMDTELRDVLGDGGFTAYRRFNESVRLRGFVDGFAVQVAETAPLAPAQAEQLAQALVAASAPPTADKARDIDPKTVDWHQVDAVAQQILTASQFSAWQLGVAYNPFGGSRIDQELTKIYEAAKAREAK